MDPNTQNQYDFITNPGQPQKKSLLPTDNKTRLIVFGGGGLIALLLLFIGIALFSGGPTPADDLMAAAKHQNELIRVADIGLDKARTQEARNIAVTTKLSLQSQQSDLLAALKEQGYKVSSSQLAVSTKSQTDNILTTAAQNNRFDEVFLEFMHTSLSEYQQLVKKAYEGVTNKNLRAALAGQYESANFLAGTNLEE